jgi:hypothetical protein
MPKNFFYSFLLEVSIEFGRLAGVNLQTEMGCATSGKVTC